MEKAGRAYIFIVIVIAIAIAGIWYALLELQKRSSDQHVDMYSLIPNDAFAVVHFMDSNNMLQGLKDSSSISEPIISALWGKVPDQIFAQLDSFKITNPNLFYKISNNQCIISLHQRPENKFNYLFQFRLKENAAINEINSTISSILNIVTQIPYDYLGHQIWTADFVRNEKIYWALFKGSVLISTRKQLLEQSITNYSTERGLDKNPEFAKIRNTAGLHNDNLFIDLQRIHLLVPESFSQKSMPLGLFSNLANWGAYDIITFENQIMLNGYLAQCLSKNCFLSAIKNQGNFNDEVLNYVPEKTKMLSIIGVKNMPQLSENLKNYFANSEYFAEHLKDIAFWEENLEIKINQTQEFVKGSLGYGYIKDLDNDFSFFLAEIQNPKEFLQHLALNEISDENEVEYSIDYELQNQSYNYYSIPDNVKFFKILTGGLISQQYNLFTISDNVLIAASDSSQLDYIINSKNQGNSIKNNTTFQKTYNSFHKTSNYFFFSTIPLDDKNSDFLLSNAAHRFMNDNKANLSRFGIIGIEISEHRDGLFYNVISLFDKKDAQLNKQFQWETHLNTVIHKGPFLVNNHLDGSKEIILQDKLNNLYLINIEGEILWKQQISGPIMSDIFQVDIFKNNRYQYLFNTRNFLHLIDRNGQYVSGYPVRLKTPVTTGLALFDYDNNKNYRIIIPNENRTIYNLTITGRAVEGWNAFKTNDTISYTAQHIKLEGKDFLFFKDNKGQLYVTDRRGNKRLSIPKNIVISKNSAIYSGNDGIKSFIITTGETGEIIKVYLDGTVKKTTIKHFSENHQFLFGNFINDEDKEYIFVDSGILAVFNDDGVELFTKNFDENSNLMLGNILISDDTYYIQVTDIENEKIYLINNNGEVKDSFPLSGNRPIIIEESNIDQSVLIIIGHKNKISCIHKIISNLP
jgi:hypothetical protein